MLNPIEEAWDITKGYVASVNTGKDFQKVRGYIEEGTTTTPFDMVVRNGMSRYHLCIEAMRRASRVQKLTPPLIQECEDMLVKHEVYVRTNLEDMPEVRSWVWSD